MGSALLNHACKGVRSRTGQRETLNGDRDLSPSHRSPEAEMAKSRPTVEHLGGSVG